MIVHVVHYKEEEIPSSARCASDPRRTHPTARAHHSIASWISVVAFRFAAVPAGLAI
jgi:hypothetical protein